MISYMNKHLAIATFLLSFFSTAIAQGPADSVETTKAESMSFSERASLRQKIFDNNNIASFDILISATTTIISPDPIVLVDISSDKAQGELSPSTDNRVFRIKPTRALLENDFVVVTVVTKKYVSVMKLIAKNTQATQAVYTIAINPSDTYRLNAFNSLTSSDFEKLALFALTRKRCIHDIKTKSNDLQAWVGNIFVAGDHILVDLSLKNKSNLPYVIESIRFRIIDKYTVSEHVSQEIEMLPEYAMYDKDNWQFTSQWRNLFIFPKFTYPDDKIFQIEVQEKQISGRKILINIDYSKILHSGTLQ
jgi:conjugative transposon TraN protein